MTKLSKVRDRDLRAELGQRMETLLANMSNRERTAGGLLQYDAWLLEADALHEMLDPVLHEPRSASEKRTRLRKAVQAIEWGFNTALALLLGTGLAFIAWVVSGEHVGFSLWIGWIIGGAIGAAFTDIALGLRRKA